MRFIRGDSLKEAIERFHADASLKARPRAAVAGAAQAASPVPRRLQRHRLRPLAGACCIATSSRGTSSWAGTARPWWSTGGWPRPRARIEPGAPASGRSCPPRPAAVGRDAAGQRLGTPAYMSPEQAGGDLDRLGPAVGRLQPRRHAVLPPDRRPPLRATTSARCSAGCSGASSRRRGGSTRRSTRRWRRSASRRWRRGRRIATPSPGRWPRTSSGGWPTSRSTA